MIMIMFIEPGVDHTASHLSFSKQYIFSRNNALENFDQILITPDWDKCQTFFLKIWNGGLPLQMINPPHHDRNLSQFFLPIDWALVTVAAPQALLSKKLSFSVLIDFPFASSSSSSWSCRLLNKKLFEKKT